MTTPAYGMKFWWRACRRAGESLKAFALRHVPQHSAGGCCQWHPAPRMNTAATWLHRKAQQKRGRASR